MKHLLSPQKWKFCLKRKRTSNIHKIPKCTIFFQGTQIMQSSLGYIYDFHKELDANTSILEFLYRKIRLCSNKWAFTWEIYSPLPDCPFTVYRNSQQNQVTNHCSEPSHLYLSASCTTEGQPLDQGCWHLTQNDGCFRNSVGAASTSTLPPSQPQQRASSLPTSKEISTAVI